MNRIKELREKAGLTLEQLAVGAGTSFQQVQRLEKGERRLTDVWMRRLAPPLGVRPEELMSGPGAGDVIRDELEAFIISFWREADERHRELAMLALAPPGYELPAIAQISPIKARKRK